MLVVECVCVCVIAKLAALQISRYYVCISLSRSERAASSDPPGGGGGNAGGHERLCSCQPRWTQSARHGVAGVFGGGGSGCSDSAMPPQGARWGV